MSFEDYVLSLPKKIDLITYRGGAGGDFFTSLIALSCPKTKPLLQHNELILKTLEHTNIQTYDYATYFHKNMSIFMKHLDYTAHMMTSEEIKSTLKFSFFSAMMEFYTHICRKKPMDDYHNKTENKQIIKKRLTTLFKDVILIKNSHFYLFDKNKVIELNSSKYWDVLSIDPITKEGQNAVIKCHDTFFPGFLDRNEIHKNDIFEKYNYKGIERFPFFDYMIYEEYDEVKYFLEKRYGSHLDFDFIDKSLKDYYKRRVAPFLK